MDAITAMRDERGKLIAEQRKIVDAVGAEKRDMTAEENQKFDKVQADIAALEARIKEAEGAETRKRQLEENEQRHKEELAKSSNPEMRTMRTGESPEAKQERSKDFSKRFRTWLSSGDPRPFSFEGRYISPREERAFSGNTQNITTAGDGGNWVPNEFERRLWAVANNTNVMRSICSQSNTNEGTLYIPTLSGGATAAFAAEEGDYNATQITAGVVTIACHKMTAYIPVTEEIINDSAFDMENEVASAIGRAFGDLEENWLVLGDGTNDPHGVTAEAGAGVTAASTTTVTGDELMELIHSLKPRYRNNGTLLTSDAMVLKIRKLKDGNGQYLWQPGLVAGTPDRLLSYPVAISDQMPTPAASAKSIIFGDFQYYRIADRIGMTLIRDPYTNAHQGVVRFTASKRVGGRIILTEAFKKLTQAAA